MGRRDAGEALKSADLWIKQTVASSQAVGHADPCSMLL